MHLVHRPVVSVFALLAVGRRLAGLAALAIPVLIAIAAPRHTAGAQVVGHAQVSDVTPLRQGFWFSGGLGAGSLGCDECGERATGLSGGLQLGGTINQHVLLGAGTTGWTKSESGATITVGTLAAIVRVYPSESGRFFLLGGLGVGTVSGAVDGIGSASESGTSAVLGIGYDIRVGEKVSLTPYYNGFAVQTNNSNANVGQLGLAITIY